MPGTSTKSRNVVLERELKTLYEISNAVQESPVSEDSFGEILRMLGKMVDYRSASLFLFSRESGQLEEVCRIGRTVDLIDFVKFDMGFGISAWVAQKRRPIVLNNLRKSKGGSHTKSFLSVPVVFSGEVTGVVNLAHDEPDSFTERDAELVSVVSSLLALLAERIAHGNFKVKAATEIESLNEQLRLAQMRMARLEKAQTGGDMAETINRKIANSLAIIAGNAQFLLMTMKNSSNSVIRRLKAIDREASSIISVTEQIKSAGNIKDDCSAIIYEKTPKPSVL